MKNTSVSAIAIGLFLGWGSLSVLSACGSDDDAATADTIVDTSGDVDQADAPIGDADGGAVDTDAGVDADADADVAIDTGPRAARIVINEIAPAGAPEDWLELLNTGDAVGDLGGWQLRDSNPDRAWTLPTGLLLPPDTYVVLRRGADGFDFGFGPDDAAFLFDADGALVDTTQWDDGDAPAGFSWGRLPNGSGTFQTLFAPTAGAANVANITPVCPNQIREATEACDGADFDGLTCEALGWGGGALSCADSCQRVDQAGCTAHALGVVINEVTSLDDDRIELFNSGASDVDVSGWVVVDQNPDQNRYTLPAGSTLEAGAYRVLVRDVDHPFGLGGADRVELRNASGIVIDAIDWRDGQAEPAWCRTPNGTGGFQTCATPSFGQAN